jgi:hypothetical protein
MAGFTKLVPEIIQSSIWNESSDVRIVWITMLAIKDENGYVRGDALTLARMANVNVNSVNEALNTFQNPDPSSHTPDNDGKRIEAAPGGWIVLNHHLYRTGDRNEYFRDYMRKRREKKPVVNSVNVNNNNGSVSVSASVSEKGDARGGAVEIPQSLKAVQGFESEWAQFLENRKAKRAKATPRAQELLLNKLSQRPHKSVSALQMAIERNWTGFEWEWMESGKQKPKQYESNI